MRSNKKNVLLISSSSKRRNRLDGVTIKSRCLEEKLNMDNDINLIAIDTDNWQINFISIVIRILANLKKADKIVICSAQRGANLLLMFFYIFNINKDIFYFVAGGRLADYLVTEKYKLKYYSKVKKIYVESDKMVNKLNSISLSNVEKLLNFRNFNFRKDICINEKVRFVFFSRVIKEKGIEDLIIAFKKLESNYSNIELDIYGEVDDNYYEQISSEFTNNIKYKGKITPNNINEYEILSSYDIFVLPTFYKGECLPGALIDAYISGLAIIASEWEYSREFIEDGVVGLIYEYKNKDDLRRKMEEMINDRDKIVNFKKNSKNIANNFHVDKILKSFIEQLKK